MPLINFKTDLTSLRYGSDKPNGGSSTQPYVQFPIPGSPNSNLNNASNAVFNNYYETNRTSLDFPIRGGRVVEVAGNTYTTPSNDIDRIRIQNFLNDKPRGTAFIQKQKDLQLTNPLTQVANTVTTTNGVQGLFNLNNAVIPITQTYNPANTLTQVAEQGTGAHFNRQGLSPSLYESPQSTYAYIAATTNNAEQNRLAILARIKLKDSSGFQISAGDIATLSSANKYGISSTQSQILNYQGGPGSVYGVGSTIIKRATSTVPAKVYTQNAFAYDQIANQDTRFGDDPLNLFTQDFRDQLDPNVVAASDYFNDSLEARLNVGNPGENNYPKVKYNDIIDPAIDKLNNQNIFYYTAANQSPWDAGGDDTRDIIKFAFECMSNDVAGNAIALVFRAFLDGAIQDSNTAEYNSFKYLGRGETFRTYQGFDRSVGFAFKILVQTRSEMQPLYRKLNHLISQVYPDYSNKSNFMRGNVVKLTIGDYLYRVPGFLESVNVTLDTNVGWEILLNQYDDSDVAQAPFVVTVSCSFKPILNILPRRENYDNPYVPLIMNTDSQFLNSVIDNFAAHSPIAPAQVEALRGPATPSAPTTFNGTTPNIQPNIQPPPAQVPPPVKKNVGGGNPRKARNKPQPKPGTAKLALYVPPRVLQDNTAYNPASYGGTYKSGGF